MVKNGKALATTMALYNEQGKEDTFRITFRVKLNLMLTKKKDRRAGTLLYFIV